MGTGLIDEVNDGGVFETDGFFSSEVDEGDGGGVDVLDVATAVDNNDTVEDGVQNGIAQGSGGAGF